MGQETTFIATQMTVAASAETLWPRLMFYEQIEGRPPLHLRLLLPTPTRTEGNKSHVGDEARCIYAGGHLIKRVTSIDEGRHYGFEVIEQKLEVGGGVQLSSGEYTLRKVDSGHTEITLATRYVSPRRPRWLWRPIEAAVCHSFHRHILGAMKREAEAK